MAVRRTGDWGVGRRIASVGGGAVKAAMHQAVLQEAHRLRTEIVTGLRTGEGLDKPSPLTLAARRMSGFSGSKSLIRTGELRNSINVVNRRTKIFVGVPRRAGKDRIKIAEIHEFGTQPFVIPVTPKMRRFLGALFASAPSSSARGSSGPRGMVVIQIPSRPFMRLAFSRWQKSGVKRRVYRKIRASVGGI